MGEFENPHCCLTRAGGGSIITSLVKLVDNDKTSPNILNSLQHIAHTTKLLQSMMTSSPSLDPNPSDVASIPDEKGPKTAASNCTSSLKVSHNADPESESSDADEPATETTKDDEDAKDMIKALLKEKLDEWTAVAQRTGPLRLLDLPMDVLKEIIKEVTHTNDLTSLALTHSALHNLAIPHIYSRFDIVWPDAHATTDPRTGVDALTYGLATLCMGGDVFGQCSGQCFEHNYYCTSCGARKWTSQQDDISASTIQRRLGNDYPRWTKKFSLGNGPADWVQEYMITKESGKMLGTLVALAVARMVNLEHFVWDMPTGVLRDVWIALASLQHRKRDKGDECRLERVWVRWHDNSDTNQGANPSTPPPAAIPSGTTMTNIGLLIPSTFPTPQPVVGPNGSIPTGILSICNGSQNRVEYPTLSVLPALKSLSVLDIDELAYLDEMSILIARSQKKLRELRVGIAAKAAPREFAHPWDGPNLQQVDHDAKWPGANTIGEKRLGGVLGVLLGRVFDIRNKLKRKPKAPSNPNTISSTQSPPSTTTVGTPAPPEEALPNGTIHGTNAAIASSVSFVMPEDPAAGHAARSKASNGNATPDEQSGSNGSQTRPAVAERELLTGQLKLQTLELERVSISVIVLHRAIDWSILTSLTILDCKQHESLWRILRRQFLPKVSPSATLSMSSLIRDSIATNTSRGISNVPMEYRLNLKKIHTDCVSSALIIFLKETLAPNTLEQLFLQDRRSQATTVTIDAIFKGPIKRHRSSLQRLMLDSSTKIPRGPNVANEPTTWRNWMLNREVLSFITSGRMSSLKELSVAIEYKDWHFFLQRLPQISQLRSLNIPFVADHVTPAYDPKELALQVVDIISLRPEIQLCYMGVSHKCFEILENRSHDDSSSAADTSASATTGGLGGTVVDHEEDDDEEDGSDDDDEEEDEEEDDDGTAIGATDADETESDLSDHDDSDGDSFVSSEENDAKLKLRLREILFYDDKVAIFKARHGKL